MELLDKRGIAGETARVQALHLAYQFLNLARHFRVFLNGLTKLVQIAHAVIVSALGRNRRVIRLNRGTPARSVVPRVKIIVNGADASPTGIGITVAATVISATDSSARAAHRTISTLAALLTLLATLALPLTFPLLLSLLAPLPIAGERIYLVAKPLDAIQGGFKPLLRIVPLPLLWSCAQGLLRVIHFLFEPLHSGRNFRLRTTGIWIDAAAHPIRAPLEAGTQIGLLHIPEGFAQLGGRSILFVGGQLTRGVLQLLFQAAQIFGELLAVIGKFSAFLHSALRPRLPALLSERLANAVPLVALLLRQTACLVCERPQARGSLLLAHAAEQIRGFLQAIGGAARFGFALLGRRRAAHVIGSLLQPVERLLYARVRRALFSSATRLA